MPRRRRERTPGSIRNRLDAIDEWMTTADPLKRLHLVQQRMDLEAEFVATADGRDLAALEAEFIQAVGPYRERKGIWYDDVWRTAGVEPRVLKAAGITPSR